MILLKTGVKILQYQGLGFQKMKVDNPYLKKYDYCNHSIFNFKTLHNENYIR